MKQHVFYSNLNSAFVRVIMFFSFLYFIMILYIYILLLLLQYIITQSQSNTRFRSLTDHLCCIVVKEIKILFNLINIFL